MPLHQIAPQLWLYRICVFGYKSGSTVSDIVVLIFFQAKQHSYMQVSWPQLETASPSGREIYEQVWESAGGLWKVLHWGKVVWCVCNVIIFTVLVLLKWLILLWQLKIKLSENPWGNQGWKSIKTHRSFYQVTYFTKHKVVHFMSNSLFWFHASSVYLVAWWPMFFSMQKIN